MDQEQKKRLIAEINRNFEAGQETYIELEIKEGNPSSGKAADDEAQCSHAQGHLQ